MRTLRLADPPNEVVSDIDFDSVRERPSPWLAGVSLLAVLRGLAGFPTGGPAPEAECVWPAGCFEIRSCAQPTLKGCRIRGNAEYGVFADREALGLIQECDLTGNGSGAWGMVQGHQVRGTANTP